MSDDSKKKQVVKYKGDVNDQNEKEKILSSSGAVGTDSCTQICSVYSIVDHAHECQINFIDTPGIGDSRLVVFIELTHFNFLSGVLIKTRQIWR